MLNAPVPPPPPPAPELAPVVPVAPAPAAAPRLSPVPVTVRDTSSTPVISFQDLLQPAKTDTRSRKKRKRKRGKKLLSLLIVGGLVAGGVYAARNLPIVQHALGRDHQAKPLPETPLVRPSITSAEFSVTLSAVQNGAPNNVTTKVKVDYLNGVGESAVESQTGGAFTSSDEIRTREFVFHPGAAPTDPWTRQPRAPGALDPYDATEFIPMVDGLVDQTLRDAAEPIGSKSEKVGDATLTTLTYRLERAKVPEIAPAIFAMVPWLFDVPNAATLTVRVSYDDSGLVRHLVFSVDPPQPGTGVDATWITGYELDVTALNLPVAIPVPVNFVDAPPA